MSGDGVDGEDIRWRISVMRTLRAAFILLGVLFAGLAYLDIFWLHRWYLAPEMILMGFVMVGTVIFATYQIRFWRARLR